MENTEPEFRSRSSGAGVSESEPRSVTSKNGKDGVQNMENTEFDVNMENTECDVKNMENTESDVLST